MEEIKKRLAEIEGKVLVDEQSLRILEEQVIDMSMNVNKLTKALLETPINGYKNVPDALHNISKTTEGLRDRYTFWNSLKKLKEKNKALYYFVTYILIIGACLVMAVHVNALVHPFGYGVDFTDSVKKHTIILYKDSTNTK